MKPKLLLGGLDSRTEPPKPTGKPKPTIDVKDALAEFMRGQKKRYQGPPATDHNNRSGPLNVANDGQGLTPQVQTEQVKSQ